jgi:antitoxin Xre/MbcA/ParS-like protein
MMSHAAAPVREPAVVLTKAVRAAAERLGLRNRELAAILGASEASISRLRGVRTVRADGREGELAALFVRLYRSLDALVGGDDAKARRWFHADNRHLGGVPADRVRSIEGLVDVVHYLDAMRGKL